MVGKRKIKNIIFIIVDTLRADYLGIYNPKVSSTPAIDEFAKKAAVFTNAYTTITKTDPAITSIMSGMYPISSGLISQGRQVDNRQEESVSKVIFLSEVLKKSGYHTAAVDWLGRWHRRGYDFYSGHLLKRGNPDHTYDNNLTKFLRGQIRLLDMLLVKLLKRDLLVRSAYKLFRKWKKLDYDPADVVIDKSLDILKGNGSKKLFLYIHLWDAHDPHMHPKGIRSFITNNVKSNYAAEVGFIDNQIGRLTDFLKTTKQFNNSLIVITADHGENFYEHDTPLHHEGLYEDVVKIPLVIKSPQAPPQINNALVQHVDLFPTVLDILGIPSPERVDGVSIRPLINNKKNETREYILFEDIVPRKGLFLNAFRRRGIRIGDYKYIEKLTGDKESLFSTFPDQDLRVIKQELYNLKRDPGEKADVSAKEEKKLEMIRKKLIKITEKLRAARLKRDKGLFRKLKKSRLIIKKSITKYKSDKIAIAWKGGKDTTVMMHIIKTMYGKIPFKVIFNDTTLEFKETYQFIEKMKKLWKLDLIVIKHDEKELEEYHKIKDLNRKKELARLMKITAINKALKKYHLAGFMLGIRRDENPARKNEKYFSQRKDHIRIHPMLDWTEEDIWEYINIFGVPYNKLYDQGYRSIGEKPFTKRAENIGNERSGRDQDKERVMESLRKLGYW